MSGFICPVCAGELMRREHSLVCAAGHCFDMARQGYVNLALSNKSSAARRGDDAAMVLARRDFLEKAYYAPVRDALLDLALPRLRSGDTLLDAGCGEGYYTAALAEGLREAGKACTVLGVDLSRDAVKAACARHAHLTLAVANCAHLPVREGSLSMLLNIFSPPELTEYARVLRPGGILLRALPMERHLYELKAAVYDRPYENEPPAPTPEGFALAAYRDVIAPITLTSREDILALFHMTPYWYKTGRADQQKLEALTTLTVTLAVRVAAYEKR